MVVRLVIVVIAVGGVAAFLLLRDSSGPSSSSSSQQSASGPSSSQAGSSGPSSSKPGSSGSSTSSQPGASGPSSSGSSSSQQETCAAVQRYRNDIVSGSDVGVLVADLKMAGEAANRGFDSTLGASLLEASTAVAQYNVNDASTRDAFLRARKVVVDATAKCDAAGSGSG